MPRSAKSPASLVRRSTVSRRASTPPKPSSSQILDVIRKHSADLLVDVTAQGLAFGEFLDACGIEAAWIRIIRGRVQYARPRYQVLGTAAGSPRR